MKKVKLMMVGAVLTMMGATTASAQVTSIEQLEGIYNMTWGNYYDEDGWWAGKAGSSTVEIRAIEGTDSIQMTGFYMDGCVAKAQVVLNSESNSTISIPRQRITNEPMTSYDNTAMGQLVFDAIGKGEFDYDLWFTAPTNQPLTGTINTVSSIIRISGPTVVFLEGQIENGTCAYKEMKLSFVEPLPMTGVKNVDAEAAVVAERWYTIDGRETMRPAAGDGQLYIVVRQMQDGTLRSSKVRN